MRPCNTPRPAKLERSGWGAFKDFSDVQKASVLEYLSEAKMLEELGEVKAMDRLHKRAAKLADKLVDEVRAKPGAQPLKARQETVKIVNAEGEPAPPNHPQPKPELPRDVFEVSATKAETIELGKKQVEPAVGDNQPSPAKLDEEAKNNPAKDETKDLGKDKDKSNPSNPEERKGTGTEKKILHQTAELRKGEIPSENLPDPVREDSIWLTADKDGNVIKFKLGKSRWAGQAAKVYQLLDSGIKGCEKGCVIKILDLDGGQFLSGSEVARNVAHGAELVAGEVPTPKILRVSADSRTPFLIQEDLHLQEFKPGKIYGVGENLEFKLNIRDPATGKKKLNLEVVAEFRKDPGLREAVAEVFAKLGLGTKKLVWEDCHLGNFYFFKDADGKWVAGILDTDRIIEFSKRTGRMGAWFDWVEAELALGVFNGKIRVNSLRHLNPLRFGEGNMIKAMEYFLQRPGPYYPNAEFFMQKMFEYKGWIYFDESTGKFESFLLVPEEIEKKFPHLKDPVWNDRFNLDDPWWKSSSKWFPPRNLPDVSAGEVWAGGWLQDAERPAPVLIPFRALGLFRNLNLVPQPNGVQKAARHLRLAA